MSSLAVAISHFGWGSLGKLRLILDELPQTPIAFFEDVPLGHMTRRALRSRSDSTNRLDACAAALVINVPWAAERLAERGLPVVYVDSLPYLWTQDAEVPQSHSDIVYCAQTYPFDRLPLGDPLRERGDIRWVHPIVPPPRAHSGGEGIVISTGGMRCHSSAEYDAYCELVLLPLARVLAQHGQRVSSICGNLRDHDCRRLAAVLPDCSTIGPRTPEEFERIVNGADLLIAAPGSTTILQALAVGLPIMLLPPQNVSQFLNAELYTDLCTGVIRWPPSVLDPEEIEQRRVRGSRALLAYVGRAMADGTHNGGVADTLQTAMAAALREAFSRGTVRVSSMPRPSGAVTVAQIVRDVMASSLAANGQ